MPDGSAVSTAIESPGRPRWLVPALIALVVAAAYAYTLTFDFVYDDQAQIVATSYVHSWRFVPRYFQEHIWSHRAPGGGSYYRPFFLLWLLTNYTLFGLRPEGWHLTTVGIHVAVTLVFYLVTLRLSRDKLTAGTAALLFGLHPVHIESVAWISGVSDPLVALLLLASFLFYLRGASGRTASLGLYALALLAKEPAVVMPVLILAHAWLFHSPAEVRTRFRSSLITSAPYFALAVVYWILRVIVLHNVSTGSSEAPVSTLLLTVPSLLYFYVKHLIWPAGLNVVYNFWLVDRPNLWNFAGPVLAIIVIAAGLYTWARRGRLVAFAAIWMFATLLPVLNLRYFLATDLVHDRYLYLPSMGFCLLLAIAIRQIPHAPARALVLVLGCLMFTLTIAESRYWANNLTLFKHASAVAPDNHIALYGLGTKLLDLGMRAEALPVFLHLYELDPQTFQANFGLGACYYHMDHVELAAKYLRRAVELRPLDATALVLLGLTELKQGKLPEAETSVREAIQVQGMEPGYELYHAQLGYVLKLKGDLAGALREFKLEQIHFPNSPGVSEQIAETEGRLKSQ